MLFHYTGINNNNKRVRGFVRAENRNLAKKEILDEHNIQLVIKLNETIDNRLLNESREQVANLFTQAQNKLSEQMESITKNQEEKKRKRALKRRKKAYKASQKKSKGFAGTINKIPLVGDSLAQLTYSVSSLAGGGSRKMERMPDVEEGITPEEELLNLFKEEQEEFGDLGLLPDIEVEPQDKIDNEIDWSLLEADEAEVHTEVNTGERFKVKVKPDEIIMLTRRLQIMLSSGVSLVNGLKILADDKNKDMNKMLDKISNDIQMGLSFSQALAKFPNQFNNTYTSLVSIGETSGNLEDSLLDIIDVMEQEEDINKQLKSAAIYPSIIGVVLVVVLILGSVFFIPMFEDIFVDLGETAELPALTKAVFAIAGYVPWITGGIFLLVMLFLFIKKRSQAVNRKYIEWSSKIALKFPVINEVVLIYNMHTFSNTVGMMVKNGVQLNKALLMAQQAINNVYIKNEIAKANLMMRNGYSLSESLAQQTYFDSILINIILVGEKTGEMDFALSEITNYYHEALERRVENLMSMVQPASMILIGLIAAPVIIAIYMPILDMSSGMGF